MKMTEQPKGLRAGEFVGQDGRVYRAPSWAHRLLHDDLGIEKNEDRYAVNTFTELYGIVSAVSLVLIFIATLVSAICDLLQVGLALGR